ncbi:YadA-like family protein [Actinobacillus seminis]|uniref:YadA-like family protein n=1 Tax=Actinobacillus seminis TaxID=722 RepID=UPI003B9432D1
MAFKKKPFVAGKWSYAAGAAHYGGEQAVAVSFGRTAESGNWSLFGGVSKAIRGDVGFRVGVSGVFN